MSLSVRDIQSLLAAAGHYTGGIDGDVGPRTRIAINSVLLHNNTASSYSGRRRMVAAAQTVLNTLGHDPGPVDGYAGYNTIEAFNSWIYQKSHHGRIEYLAQRSGNKSSGVAPHNGSYYPHQDDVEDFYGPVGKHQTRIDLPYPMTLSWDKEQSINTMLCHEKVADPMRHIFNATLRYYGLDRVTELGLDMFGGCLNVRRMRGGSEMSMHSWGIAVDLDPANNRLRWNRERARFAQSDYDAFWLIVEEAGATSLGRTRDFDWMHFQFARI